MFIGSKEQCDTLQAAMSKSLGYPRRDGVNIGEGIHVVIPEEYSPGAPGWTENYSAPVPNAKGDSFALELGSFDSVEKFDAKALTDQELSAVSTALEGVDVSLALPVDWYPETVPAVADVPVDPEPPGVAVI